jgi:hypothetical protein
MVLLLIGGAGLSYLLGYGVLGILPNRSAVALITAKRGEFYRQPPWWLDWRLGDSDLFPCGDVWAVDLSGAAFTDDDMRSLAELKALTHLHLNGTAITSDGLRNLSDMRRLGTLSLSETAVDDTGIEHLERLTSLRIIHLTGTRVTPEGAARLRRALPKTYVKY